MKRLHLFVLMAILSSLTNMVVCKPLIGLVIPLFSGLFYSLTLTPKPPLFKKDVLNDKQNLEELLKELEMILEGKKATITLIEEGNF
jgi:hypothetical protein